MYLIEVFHSFDLRYLICIFVYLHSLYFRYFPLSLSNDLNGNPLKTIIAARAEVAMVCSYGIRITNAITNVIAAVTVASGVHTLMAL